MNICVSRASYLLPTQTLSEFASVEPITMISLQLVLFEAAVTLAGRNIRVAKPNGSRQFCCPWTVEASKGACELFLLV